MCKFKASFTYDVVFPFTNEDNNNFDHSFILKRIRNRLATNTVAIIVINFIYINNAPYHSNILAIFLAKKVLKLLTCFSRYLFLCSIILKDLHFYICAFSEFQKLDKEIRKECLVKSNEASYVNECGT